MPYKKLRSLVDMILRVPPLFLIDVILKSNYSITIDLTKSCLYVLQLSLRLFRRSDIRDEVSEASSVSFIYVLYGAIYLLGFMAALSSFLLSTRHLVSIYLMLASSGVVMWSYTMNVEYMKYCIALREQDSSLLHEMFLLNLNVFKMLFGSYVLQLFMGIMFCFSTKSLPNFPRKKSIASISFIFPTLISIFPLPACILSIIPVFSVFVTFSFLLYYLLKNSETVYAVLVLTISYIRTFIHRDGIINFLIHRWQQLQSFHVLRLFWIIRTAIQAVFLIYNITSHEIREHASVTQISFSIAKELFTQSCDTFLAVLGTTCILTGFLVNVVNHMQSFLLMSTEERRNIAPVISVVFLTLAMQTGLTALEPQTRCVRIYRNVILMLSTVSQSIHESIHSVLVALSISGSTYWNKHFRALTAGFLLILFSLWMLRFLWLYHSYSAWLLAASAFSLEVIIKVLLSFIIYFMNMADTHYVTVWENFDDYMFCIISLGNIISFSFGVFLFFNACYIVVYDSVGVTRIFMMFSHLYFNIWSEIEAGWRVCRKRIFASKLIKSLPEASKEQLQLFNDVCSICHQTLNSARVTTCNHYFHTTCLKRWLYEQNTCPFCHRVLHNIEQPTFPEEQVLPEHMHQE